MIDAFWIHQFYLQASIACYVGERIGFHDTAFETIAFTLRFWLKCFAVYASPLSLPTETQDSLDSEAGYFFYRGTCTHKRDAPCPSAAPDPGKKGLNEVRPPSWSKGDKSQPAAFF